MVLLSSVINISIISITIPLNRYSKECSDALRPLLTHLENNSLTIPNNELPRFLNISLILLFLMSNLQEMISMNIYLWIFLY